MTPVSSFTRPSVSTRPTAELDDLLATLDRSGDLLGCVEVLTELQRRNPTTSRAKRLVALRHEAFMSAPETPDGDEDWPGDVGPPLPLDGRDCADGLATVRVDELSCDVLRRGIQHHGALRIKEFLNDETVFELRSLIEQAWHDRDTWAAGDGQEPFGLYSPFVPRLPHRIGPLRVWAEQTGGLLGFDAPQVLLRLIEVLADSGAIAAIEEYLGERPVLSYDKTALRRVGVDTNSDWHQDGAFLGADLRTVNIWIALTDCGVDAPGLDVVPRRVPELLETGTSGAYFDWSIGDDVVRDHAGPTGVVRPRFAAGEALLFDQFCVHRTAVSPTMTKPRFAVESWFFAASTYPADRIPLWV